ncbi:MAG: sortase [Aeromicrobium sp.]
MLSPLTRRSVLATCAAAGLAGCGGRPSAPSASVAPQPDSAGASSKRRRRVAATPVHLAIPTIGVDTRLVRLGLREDGTVEVPSVRGTAGWFRLGTVPGQRGSAVILGHVDSVDGPDVFADLSALRSPDRVQVALSDDGLVTFEVIGIETYANADFPADRVYAGSRRTRALNLVTCGGDYDPERGGYPANVVVYTRRARA